MASTTFDSENLMSVMAKYEAERQKRLRPDGLMQYADIGKSDKFKHFGRDPWAGPDNKYASQPPPMSDGESTKILILGAGFSALQIAVRLIEGSGFRAEDVVFVDSAWGFGGVWYWNRYPGLMCDVEASVYMPLLEETGYMPRHRFAYGSELREYAESLAERWGLTTRALFGTTVQETSWDGSANEWVTTVEHTPPGGQADDGQEPATTAMRLRSRFLVLASGTHSQPKLPAMDGLLRYQGRVFHTSRWDYGCTGGSPTDMNLDGLRGKRVAYIGTGATAVQVVPQLAKWADKLLVFQRTPAAVDERGQRPIDEAEWKNTVTEGGRIGWQRRRRENMAAFLSDSPDLPEVDLVDDGWTRIKTFSALVGTLRGQGLTMETVQSYVLGLYAADLPRQQRIRARVAATVKDETTAASLQPWYPSWCKRPCFHDEYLDAFNQSNVQLVDTDGRGIAGFSESGVLACNQEYPVDVVIFGTGYDFIGVGSAAYTSRITVTGRGGRSLDDKWDTDPGSLHGLVSCGFPNLILTSPLQGGPSTVNIIHTYDVLATHCANVLAAAAKQAGLPNAGDLVIEPTAAAEAAWIGEVVQQALTFAGVAGCTPGYLNGEGSADRAAQTPEEQIVRAKRLAWGYGILDYITRVEAWEAKGDLSDFHIQVAA